MYYHRDHYIMEGWSSLHKRYMNIGGGKNIEWLKKLAKKSYYTNNWKRIRIRKITSEIVWKNTK